MTEKQLRKKAADCISAWGGTKQGSKKHKEIIDTYNSQKVLPSGYKMNYTDAWCAASVSVVGLTLGMNTEEFPAECSCRRMIDRFKKLNLWVEDDKYNPGIGDLIMYYWNDNKNIYMVEDCTKDPNHVGMVTAVNGNTFTVFEGNMTSAHVVGSRTMEINRQYIRGFCTPNYAAAAKRLTAAEKASQAAAGASVRAFTTANVKICLF